MQKKLKSIGTQLLKLLFSVALIYWLVSSGKLDFQSLKQLLQPLPLIIGTGLVAITHCFATYRWTRFLHSQDLKVTFIQGFQLNAIGNFFNFAVPGGVGGDLVKGYYITKASPHAKMDAAVSVLMDRLSGLLAMSLLALAMLVYRWDLVSQQRQLLLIFYTVLTVNLASFAIWAHIFSHRLHQLGWVEAALSLLPKSESFLKIYRAVSNYRHTKQVFLPALLLSITGQTIAVFFFVLAGQALGYNNVPLSTYFVAVPIAFMVQSLPLSPAGVGVAQTASYFIFELLTPGSGPLGSVSTTAFQIAQFIFGLLGAYFYLGISKKLKNSNPTRPQTEEYS